MPLTPGTQFGPFQILALIGAGGMGEVHRARDTKLGRDVALKVLPDGFVHDLSRMARLKREAQLLASLNHPNIAAIYGLEESAERTALVLEFVDGETLADRIGKGPLPVDEAVRISLQIAEALEAAHEKNVIHRDLKPANVKITSDDKVKVLDFGLAKVLEDESSVSQTLSQSPTLSAAMTGAGFILGTPGYMAPEQARGKTTDRRADVWAFGVILFEMLSGRRLYQGETVGDTLAKIIEREPDLTQLPAHIPAPIRRLLQRCLTKKVQDRLQAIGEARIALQEFVAQPTASIESVAPSVRSGPRWRRLAPWALAPLFLVAGWLLKPSGSVVETGSARVDYALPPGQALGHNNRTGVAISPDGRRVAYVGSATPGNPRQIYVRSVDQWDPIAIAGTENAYNPVFSPDGQWLAFQQRQQIKKVALAGGAPVVLIEKLPNQGADWGPPGISWGANGKIVFSNGLGTGLRAIRDSGGESEEFTTLDAAAGEASHRLPHVLPDGSAVLFTVLRYTSIAPDWKRAQIWVKSLKTGERKLLLENGIDARYAGNGVLVFARQGKLFAVRFDPSALSVSGNPVQVLDGVSHSLFGQAAVTWTGAAQFSISQNGSLVYGPGGIEPPLFSSLVWVDRSGTVTPLKDMRPMSRFAPRVSPDGARVSFSELHLSKDIWVFDPTRGTEERVTYEGQNAFLTWSRDGSRLAFRSDRAGPLRIYLASEQNLRNPVEITMGPLDVPSSWTPDGKELLFTRGFSATGGNTDIYAVPVDEPKKVRSVVATKAEEGFPELSPDGKWLAYCSDETGGPELYVQPYPGPGKRVTVTSDGAQEPAWSKNSSELFYRRGQRMMSVRFKVTGEEFVPEKPVMLFDQFSLGAGTSVRATYDVAPDGRFLFNQPVPEPGEERNRKIFPSTLRFGFDWIKEVERLLANAH